MARKNKKKKNRIKYEIHYSFRNKKNVLKHMIWQFRLFQPMMDKYLDLHIKVKAIVTSHIVEVDSGIIMHEYTKEPIAQAALPVHNV